ncbi:MAG TPA: pentapeptide repeat-containing protein [Streptosporangiaceae bacterium]|nr:pentapeptide repeat-containing protein [Streptosporangiaceae bacterium]
MKSALISAAVACLSVLAIAAAAGVGLRISRWVSRRLAGYRSGHLTRAPQKPPRTARGAAQGRPPALSLSRWRLTRWRAARRQRRADGLARQRHAADRYARAMGQLSSDRMDVRVSGIYALGRSAPDPGGDHPAVPEVLAQFIRTQSRKQWPAAGSGGDPAPGQATRPDVQAALTVIGLWGKADHQKRVDLTLANLPGASLIGGNFADAKLTGADLAAADLTGADLSGADLISADLADAKLTRADLTRAKLTGADLTHARLDGSRLNGADMRRVNLTGADLTGADLTGARWPMASPLPGGWLHDPGSGQLTRADVAARDPGRPVAG